jgi:predicted acetyltransferase
MGFEIRTVTAEEFVRGQTVVETAFFHRRPQPDSALWKLPYVDLDRTWAAFDGPDLVATLRTFGNELTVPGGAQLAVDAVTNVTVLPSHRRRGSLNGMMSASLAQAAERGDAVSILIAALWPIYGRYGYGPAVESAAYTIDTRKAVFRSDVVDRGRLSYVDTTTARAAFDQVYEASRRTQVGAIQRQPELTDIDYNLATAPGLEPWKGYCVLHHDVDGAPDGLLRYHVDDHWSAMVPGATLVVDDLIAATPEAYAALWRLCCEIDNVATVSAGNRSVDEPLRFLLTDGRAVTQRDRTDFVWVRLLDVPAALSARAYGSDDELVLEVDDPLGYAHGRFALAGGPGGATCSRTGSAPDLRLSAFALGAGYLGGMRLSGLAAAGLVTELEPGAVNRADAMFQSDVTPWCNTWF